jgi:AraC-like DNA-binding protein
VTDSSLAYFLTVASLTVIGFSGHLLLLRAIKQPLYLPLALCLAAIAVLICQPVFKTLVPGLQLYFLLLSLPALYIIPPCFWLYVQGITSGGRWQLNKTHHKHFVFSAVGFGIVICTLLLPKELQQGLLVEGNEQVLQHSPPMLRNFVYGLLIATFLLVMGWALQAGYYIYAVFRDLKLYREQLKQVFASTEAQEGRWINWILAAVIGLWLLLAGILFYDNLIGPVHMQTPVKDGVILALLWSIAVWGLRQKPGFADLDQQDVASQETLLMLAEPKYQRSALYDEMADKIQQQLTAAMVQDQLYLDASLSLPKLAKHIFVSPNYVSQTLNQKLGVNFFDYVNSYRVNAAKELLCSSNDTVLDIAMNVGFNAKSSFYTAFQKETGCTPSQYRKISRLSAKPAAETD